MSLSYRPHLRSFDDRSSYRDTVRDTFSKKWGRLPPPPRPNFEEFDAKLADIREELKAQRLGGENIFTNVTLQKPAADLKPWYFKVDVDAIKAARAVRSRYSSYGAFHASAQELAEEIIRATTPTMHGLNHYRIELNRK